MESFYIPEDQDIPEIKLDAETGVFSIIGKSYPEDTIGLYLPVLDWLDEYIANPAEKTSLKFDLEYFNSSSYKAFLNILVKLEKLLTMGKKVKVDWYFLEIDEDMREGGEEFAALVDIPFNFIIKEDEDD